MIRKGGEVPFDGVQLLLLHKKKHFNWNSGFVDLLFKWLASEADK